MNMLEEFCEMTGLSPDKVMQAVVSERERKPPTRMETSFGVIEIVTSEFMPLNRAFMLQDKPGSFDAPA